MRDELRERAKKLWPQSIPVGSAKMVGKSLVITSSPLFKSYPATLAMRVEHGRQGVEMRQDLPGCGSRSWDIDEDEALRALERQWKGMSAQMPEVLDKPT